MTLIYERVSAEPRTHALVIGVGRFPHLKGNNPELIEALQNVADVTSPPNNAVAVVDWLLAAADRLIPPLGSVELLVSSSDGSAVRYPRGQHSPPQRTDDGVDPATGDRVEAALQSWLQRAEDNEENLSLFYGSSHGMQTQEHILLLEDAGASANDPWRNMLSLNHLHRNLYRKANRRGVLFADCCRDLLEEGLATLDRFSGRRIGQTSDRQYARAKSDPRRSVYMLRAAPLGSVAKATRGGLGYFTAALLKCFEGATGEQKPQFGWCVSPEILRRAVEHAGRYGLNFPDDDIRPRDEESHWVGDPILRLEGMPTYPVRVREALPRDEGRSTLTLENAALQFSASRPPTFRSGTALCAWAPPSFEHYQACGSIAGTDGAADVALECVAVPVLSATGHDVRLRRL